MLRFLIHRLILAVAVLLVSSFAIYGSLYLAPGDPITTLSGGRELTPQARTALEEEYHLDDPFVVRYVDWLAGVAVGDFGESVVARGQEVRELIVARADTTFLLVGLSAALVIVIGVAAGTLAGLKPGAIGGLITVAASIGLAIPSFVAAMLLIAFLAVELGWFPVAGSGSGLLDKLYHLVLPSVSLALATLAYVARITEVSVEDELASEHVETARVRGLPSSIVIRRHVLRNAAIPIVTTSGLMVGYLIIGSAVVEKAFALDGLGAYLVDSVANNDYAVVQAISLLVVVAFVFINTIIDVLYSLLDPRIKLQ